MWDHVVFKKPKPVVQKSKAGAGKGKGGNKLNYKEFMKMKYEDLGLDEDFDTQYRPQQKVGTIMTVLAHYSNSLTSPT